MTYNCVWSETSLDADNRSHYGVATLVNNTLDKAELGFIHRNGFQNLPVNADGAVVVVHGAHQATSVQRVVDDVARLGWAVVIVIADEAGIFPVDRFRRDRRKVWIQMPVPGRHDWADRRLICSHPHDAEAFLCHFLGTERIFDWSFAGQVNHVNRRACVEAARRLAGEIGVVGSLYESPRFWDGLPRSDYYKMLAQSKIALCPTGACTPDTMRVAEALEAGCVPIVEDVYPPGFPLHNRGFTGGYWEYVLGEVPPFPLIRDWEDLPEAMTQALSVWPENRDRLQEWWKGYKNKMTRWLEEDVRALAG